MTSSLQTKQLQCFNSTDNTSEEQKEIPKQRETFDHWVSTALIRTVWSWGLILHASSKNACDFFLSKLKSLCKSSLMKTNHFSYESTPAGVVTWDPLSTKCALWEAAQGLRVQLRAAKNAKRHSTFPPILLLTDTDAEYEPEVNIYKRTSS